MTPYSKTKSSRNPSANCFCKKDRKSKQVESLAHSSSWQWKSLLSSACSGPEARQAALLEGFPERKLSCFRFAYEHYTTFSLGLFYVRSPSCCMLFCSVVAQPYSKIKIDLLECRQEITRRVKRRCWCHCQLNRVIYACTLEAEIACSPSAGHYAYLTSIW